MTTRKNSKKRDAVLEAFASTKEHPGAYAIYSRLKDEIPALSVATVYRNIRVLRESGKLASLGVVNGEERFDGVTEPHAHTICTKCGKVSDLSDEMQKKLEKSLILEIPGFSMDKRAVVFYGLCSECSKLGSLKE